MNKRKITNNTLSTIAMIRKLIIIILMIIFASAIFTSCGPGIEVSSDYDKSVNFSEYKTFGLYDVKSSAKVNQLNEDRIIKCVKEEMTKKGLTENDSHPDLLINIATVLKSRRGITASGYGYSGFYRPYGYWGYPASTTATINTYDYKDGSLVIDIIDTKSNKMIWTGSAKAEMYNNLKNPEETIKTTVAKIMVGFPTSYNNNYTNR